MYRIDVKVLAAAQPPHFSSTDLRKKFLVQLATDKILNLHRIALRKKLAIGASVYSSQDSASKIQCARSCSSHLRLGSCTYDGLSQACSWTGMSLWRKILAGANV